MQHTLRRLGRGLIAATALATMLVLPATAATAQAPAAAPSAGACAMGAGDPACQARCDSRYAAELNYCDAAFDECLKAGLGTGFCEGRRQECIRSARFTYTECSNACMLGRRKTA